MEAAAENEAEAELPDSREFRERLGLQQLTHTHLKDMRYVGPAERGG